MKQNYFHSVILDPSRCIGCTYCLKTCPTEAIRLKNGMASIIGERCIDCGECIRICPNHAKNSITDDIGIIKKYKYSVGLTLPVLYGQFKHSYTPVRILSALKSLGFDEVADTSMGSEIVGIISKRTIMEREERPVISSSCPAILRLIQVSFPELIGNILDVETPVEITARMIKQRVSQEHGLSMGDIGVILITPCTARVTSIKNPLGIDYSYIDGAISIKDVYGPMLKTLSSPEPATVIHAQPTYNGMLCSSAGGQTAFMGNDGTLMVDGIHNAISILEEIEIGRLSGLSFIELMACPGGCLGGPLVVENRYIALNNIKGNTRNCKSYIPSESDVKKYIDMYKSGFIRLTEKIPPKSVSKLDSDITKSIEKMDNMQSIVSSLPGIDCGICGSPTCRAFAEDVVTGTRHDIICPIVNLNHKLKRNSQNPGGIL